MHGLETRQRCAKTFPGQPCPLRERAGKAGGLESLRLLLGASFLLASISAVMASNEGQQRWRVFDQSDYALLTVADSDEAGDDLPSLHFRCRKGSGTIVVKGDVTGSLRNTIADLIRTNQYPRVLFVVANSDETGLLTPSFSEVTGWEYGFDLSVDGKVFERLKHTGALEFKVGKASVRREFKVGLENIAKFQDICKRPPR